jgi:hypothetical protein
LRRPRISTSQLDASAGKLRLIIQAWNPNHILGAVFGPLTINATTVSGTQSGFHTEPQGANSCSPPCWRTTRPSPNLAGKAVTAANTQAHIRPQPGKPGEFQISATVSQLALEDLRLDSFKLEGSANADQISQTWTGSKSAERTLQLP